MGTQATDLGKPLARFEAHTRTRPFRERGPLRRFLRNRAAAVGAGLVLIVSAAALFAPLVATHDPDAQNLMASLQGPSSEHWFGTDNLGRDVYSRVVYGGRITIPVALLGVAVALVIGTPIGLIAGYVRGITDTLIMRTTDVLLAFPSMLLAIAITSALGIALSTISIAIAVFSVPVYIRLVRLTPRRA
jgi:peptide/nickel transport system permease protein